MMVMVMKMKGKLKKQENQGKCSLVTLPVPWHSCENGNRSVGKVSRKTLLGPEDETQVSLELGAMQGLHRQQTLSVHCVGGRGPACMPSHSPQQPYSWAARVLCIWKMRPGEAGQGWGQGDQ